MRALEGSTKALYVGFFASHIVFTLIVDVQAIAPPSWVPAPLRRLLAFYAATFKDPLMRWPTPVWFRSVVGCEMAFQLPFFFVACHQLVRGRASKTGSNRLSYPGWFRNACVAYGAHTATTLVPILAALVSSPDNTPSEKAALVSLYAPYLVLPLGILYLACANDDDDDDDEEVASSKKVR
jgi:EXPERA (EXPanded EBP superfamily)